MVSNNILEKKYKYFVNENEMVNYTIIKEFPLWKYNDMPNKIVAVDAFARLLIVKGSFLFSAYDENDNVIYEEIFNLDNQQTLLFPNIRHTAKPLTNDIECYLQFYKKYTAI
jgi:tellurite methyltransferase